MQKSTRGIRNLQTPYVAQRIHLVSWWHSPILSQNSISSSSTAAPPALKLWFHISYSIARSGGMTFMCIIINWGAATGSLSVMWYIYLCQNANCRILKFQLLIQEWWSPRDIVDSTTISSSSVEFYIACLSYLLWRLLSSPVLWCSVLLGQLSGPLNNSTINNNSETAAGTRNIIAFQLQVRLSSVKFHL